MYGESFIKSKTKLFEKWGVESFYWHPLYYSDKPDLIALKKVYWEDKKQSNKIVELLLSHNIKEVIEVRSDKQLTTRKLVNTDMLWNGDDYFWNNEAFWYDESYEWLIYVTHEDSITFGGKWLVENVKRIWSEYIDDLLWDEK